MCDTDHYVNAVGGQVDNQIETMVLHPQVNIPQRFGYDIGLSTSDNFPSDMLQNTDIYINCNGGFY